ncbi:rRNA maturation RNase YbeY [Desertimonas flava]|uniref:rRNA maturation RNase YbeY n=1 Tax=Desertimonas flava TaxID=2064846 RepID=UPI000E34292E|nr:rRNA maturation RNase YbeY [Desertimonas flava]
MTEPPSPTVGAEQTVTVVGADEQAAVDVDVDRWSGLATRVLEAEGRRGELTLTFIERDEMAALNAEHMGKSGPTDVLSFPLDDDTDADALAGADVPVLLGDVVICPAVAAEQAADHAGTLDDELALLVVHGILHVLGHDHAEPAETAEMRAAELAHLERFHWGGPAPTAFRQEHDS